MTNSWVDIKNANVVMVMGGNPAEAHPCGFKWVVEAKAHNKAKLIVVDPRFTRTAAVADVFAQIRPGTDIAFLGGMIRHLLDKGAIQKDYVASYTTRPATSTTGPPGRTSSGPTASRGWTRRSSTRARSTSS
jgi:formate dehydrogenase major subunit